VPFVPGRNDFWQLSLKLVRSFLGEEALYQKRAYKLLYFVTKKVHASFLGEVAELLKEFQSVSSVSKAYRLLGLSEVWSR